MDQNLVSSLKTGDNKDENRGQRKGICLILKKVDSQQRVNNVSFTHRETAEVL